MGHQSVALVKPTHCFSFIGVCNSEYFYADPCGCFYFLLTLQLFTLTLRCEQEIPSGVFAVYLKQRKVIYLISSFALGRCSGETFASAE